MAKAGDALHRAFFGLLSRLPAAGAQESLRRYFDWWHRRPDPWRYTSDSYELDRHAALLGCLPRRDYARILDVGCSEGVFTDLLSKAHPAAETLGVDISAQAVRSAEGRAASAARFACLDIRRNAPQGAFDLVVCTEMLYYVGGSRSLRLVSRRLAGLLEPGGVLVASHPFPESRRLHRHFSAAGPLRPIEELVVRGNGRSYGISVYGRAPAPFTALL
ncbi:SAM-dependent methyltransferase [Nonomuraea fuscirosea]|jgi:trans-aconitate methyltransferase|uniref:class I SAM-dependent methyltransferase n=1 Tax=Nonomuraea fuscirosea TaxID=1291556 RepID=UPI002DD9054A|nr:SAM-dependent methyltransferase [Nonomuraea fuscirosea]WSA54991.1 nodulation S family protein [Nonomuraea fuscirosea]